MERKYLNVYYLRAMFIPGKGKSYKALKHSSYMLTNNHEDRLKSFRKNSGFNFLSSKDVINIRRDGYIVLLEDFPIEREENYYQLKRVI